MELILTNDLTGTITAMATVMVMLTQVVMDLITTNNQAVRKVQLETFLKRKRIDHN